MVVIVSITLAVIYNTSSFYLTCWLTDNILTCDNEICSDTASCRSPVDGRWYKYDDHEVNEMSANSIRV